jgi:hypothetical protein
VLDLSRFLLDSESEPEDGVEDQDHVEQEVVLRHRHGVDGGGVQEKSSGDGSPSRYFLAS